MWSSLWAFARSFWWFRAGPENFPYHPELLRPLMVLSALLATARLAVLLPWPPAAVAAIVSLLFVLWVTRQWLDRLALGHRWAQTVGSLMVVQITFEAVTLYPAHLLAPSIAVISATGKVPADMPLLPLLFTSACELWAFFLTLHTLQAALNLQRWLSAVVTLILLMTVGLIRQAVASLLG